MPGASRFHYYGIHPFFDFAWPSLTPAKGWKALNNSVLGVTYASGIRRIMVLLRAHSNSRCVAALKPAVRRVVRLASRSPLVACRMPGDGLRERDACHRAGKRKRIGSTGQRNDCRSGAHLGLRGRRHQRRAAPSCEPENGWPRTYSKAASGPAACQPYNPTNSRLERGYTGLFECARIKTIMRMIPEADVTFGTELFSAYSPCRRSNEGQAKSKNG
jgi:hypothetical protein